MKSNFTLSLGVRWDYLGVPTVPNELAIQPKYSDLYGISGFGISSNPPRLPAHKPRAVATQQFVSGKTGIPLYKNDWNNFAPFVGFAYSPSFSPDCYIRCLAMRVRASIRAGYSMSFLHDGVTTFTNALGTGTTNPGLIQTANLTTLTSPPSSNTPGQLTAAGVPLVTPTFLIQSLIDRTSWQIRPTVSGRSIQIFEPRTYTSTISGSSARYSRIPLLRFAIAVTGSQFMAGAGH